MPADLFDTALVKTLRKDRTTLENTALPIVTVSASYKEDIKGFYGLPEDESVPDVVFSRAHYSMAVAVAVSQWGKGLNGSPDATKAWIADPTNYVSHNDWRSVSLTEFVGKTIARQPLLKVVKDFIDKFGRQKLPILDSITPPLLYLTEQIDQPILSLHIAAGNILADQGKKVLQVITDPHVRRDYLEHAENPKLRYCVFDQKTKQDVLEKSALLDTPVDPERITVTGPPIDPRIIAARKNKTPWRNGPLNLCLSTGGLGTNKQELMQLLRQLLPELRKRSAPYRILVYTATHQDIYEAVVKLAAEERVTISPLEEDIDPRNADARLRVIYHPQIVDANERLIHYGFPWADGFLTKPSGDMAYDAAVAGCFLLTLQEWGEWEEVIREIFVQKGIARRAVTNDIVTQLESLMLAGGASGEGSSASAKGQPWIEQAQLTALQLPPLFHQGVANIVKAYRKFADEA